MRYRSLLGQCGVGGDDVPGQRAVLVQFQQQRPEFRVLVVLGPMSLSASTIADLSVRLPESSYHT
jgi:hypothetical protein